VNWQERIVVDPVELIGEPAIKGTCLVVESLFHSDIVLYANSVANLAFRSYFARLTMLSVELPKPIEKQLWNVVQSSYQGDLRIAILAFLQLHEKYGWKEQLLKDVQSIRTEIRRKGGIKTKAIDDAVKKYRRDMGASGG
jgi:hypothetical protein